MRTRFAVPETLYRGKKVAFLTRHGKEALIAPVLEPGLSCVIHHVDTVDTDQLGTFTREIPRDGSQIEAARKKARIGMELARVSVGLASEGAFGPDPVMGAIPWNLECLVWIDDDLGIEVTGLAQGEACSGHLLVKDWEEVTMFARQIGFPEHGVSLRPENERDPRIQKGITDWTDLAEQFFRALSLSTNGRVFLETDLRAHINLTRREIIRRAAWDLLSKLRSLCPACGTPGFSVVERVEGVPCADCGAPTHEIRADIHGCRKCAHRAVIERTGAGKGNPLYCDTCNP
ncbi:DUF6671 family protein [Leptospirillum ferriphilum]|uniref:DUF6671 domain-containing protein n=1 Tax=Leptospirillum ferriphilum YSK TaxID=1441628 RepID=A0A059Y035_9BACT|nr:DUF6671 family protein [Leptospirillum ferriphilum]AIA30807.1 hypothetical protein Y981_08795 [Leptospirillum ferriphilum YSK]